MPRQKWHEFEEGETYDRDHVVQVIQDHLDSGDVENVEDQKEEHLRIIKSCPHEKIVFSPTDSWRRSPMNSLAWRAPDGSPLA
jgi:hypothetical protein